jgi:phospholipid/cholesterol/gamma-HCH transport system substrate-binding protein
MTRVKLQLRRYGRYFAMLMLLWAIGLGAGVYILANQRFPNPFASFLNVSGQFETGAAVVPGLGEPVNVAGVNVGEITAVSLEGGLAVIHMKLDPGKLPAPHVLYRNATARLFPNTPLKDMEIDIDPGTAAAGTIPQNGTIPASQTTVPIDSDELLDSLDTDTRTWFASLITSLNQGTSGRGQDIRQLFENLGPTSVQLRQVGDMLAARRHELAGIVHNLGALSQAVSQRDAQLQNVVREGDSAISALAGQNVELRDAVTRLPATLSAAQTTLPDVRALADALGPTATALIPTAHRLPTTLRDADTLFQGAALLPLNKIPPFVNAAIPLANQLPSVVALLDQALPALTSSFKVLAGVTNELTYVPGNGNPGFLYWLAWFAHNANSFLSASDANGSAWRGIALVSCQDFQGNPLGTLLNEILGQNLESLLRCTGS